MMACRSPSAAPASRSAKPPEPPTSVSLLCSSSSGRRPPLQTCQDTPSSSAAGSAPSVPASHWWQPGRRMARSLCWTRPARFAGAAERRPACGRCTCWARTYWWARKRVGCRGSTRRAHSSGVWRHRTSRCPGPTGASGRAAFVRSARSTSMVTGRPRSWCRTPTDASTHSPVTESSSGSGPSSGASTRR